MKKQSRKWKLKEISPDIFASQTGEKVFICRNEEFLFSYTLPKLQVMDLIESKAAASKYESEIRFASSALWNGHINPTIFILRMFSITRRGLEDAFERGMKSVGIDPSDITPNERLQFGEWLTDEQTHIVSLANFIQNNRREFGGNWKKISNRIKLWGKRFRDIRNKSRTLGGLNAKLEWRLGLTEKNCKSCSRLNGKVKRASWWAENEVYPQNPPNDKLECKGWKCDCDLDPTDKPLTRGRMPNLP